MLYSSLFHSISSLNEELGLSQEREDFLTSSSQKIDLNDIAKKTLDQIHQEEIPSISDRFFTSGSLLPQLFEPINKDHGLDINKSLFERTLDHQTTICLEEIDKFSNKVIALEKSYKDWVENLNEYGTFQENILTLLEYGDINRDNFLQILKLSSFNDNSTVESSLGGIFNEEEIPKWVNVGGPVMFNLVKWCLVKYVQSDLENHRKRLEELKREISYSFSLQQTSASMKIEVIQRRIEHFASVLIKDRHKSEEKGLAKIDKLAGKVFAIPISHLTQASYKTAGKVCKSAFNIFKQIYEIYTSWQIRTLKNRWMFDLESCLAARILVDSGNLFEEAQDFLDDLSACTTIRQVNQILNQNKLTIETSKSFEEWKIQLEEKRFRRHLIQTYYFARNEKPFMHQDYAISLLNKRQAEFDLRTHAFLLTMTQHINQCQNLEFEEIQEYLEKLHIYLDQLPNPPKDKAEWLQKTNDVNFCKSLTQQHIHYQETQALLLEQGMRQALLSKSQIEYKFIVYRVFEDAVSIISSFIQLVLFVPALKLLMVASILEIFITDLSKFGIPGVGFIHIFYPEMSLKLNGVLLLVCEYLFASQYKPHEYSIESYKLACQIRWFEFVSVLHYFSSLLEQVVVWLNIQLIEGCMMGIQNKSEENQARYNKINEKLEKIRLNCKLRIINLNKQLDLLRLKDADVIFNPQIQGLKNQNTFENIAQGLKDVDFHYFPKHVHMFFEENFGIKLGEEHTDKLKENLEQFFLQSEQEFIQSYEIHNPFTIIEVRR